MKMEVCHLHVHSEFSFLDGYCRLEELVKGAEAGGIKALALTDHFNMSGSVPFYQLALAAGIKPIFGVEIVLEPPECFHLVLLAKNNQGYVHLMELVTRALMRNEGTFHVKWDELREKSPGLIALSGCRRGEIPYLLQKGLNRVAQNRARAYRNLFGQRNFYLEISASFPPMLKKRLIRLSEESGLPLAGTNNVHYVEREEQKEHEQFLVLQKISRGSYPSHDGEQYLLQAKEMKEKFKNQPEILRNTREIADRCNVSLDLYDLHLPSLDLPEELTPEAALEKLVRSYHTSTKKEYEERLQRELDIIKRTGFAGYFLIVHDIVSFCLKQNIPVTARGSAVGSYVGYLLGMGTVDPVANNLYFERFLNPERASSPDIDLDISHTGRKKVLEYLYEKYGEGKIAHIGAFSTFAGRAAVHDAAKALGLDEEEASYYSSLVRSSYLPLGQSMELATQSNDLARNDHKIKEVLGLAGSLLGRIRHLTQHSSGVVLAPEGLTNYTALQYSRDGEIITQLDMHGIEALGLLKIDLLGSRFQSAIQFTQSEVKDGRSLEIKAHNLPPDDQKTYTMLGQGNSMGVFQLESTGTRLLMGRMRPRDLKDLIAATSLYRPGPLKSGMAENYLQRRQRGEQGEPPHPALRDVLKDSLGTIIWQEQVMETARVLAGYSLGQADILRRAMSKKSPVDMAGEKTEFISRSTESGIERDQAEEIFDLLSHFSSYCFNKAHAAAYAQLIYQTAYLKTYFPLEYMVALFNSHWGDQGRISKYLLECRRMNIDVLGIDINCSNSFFSLEEGKLRLGLAAVKNIGIRAVQAILEEREKGKFKSFDDFLYRMQFSRSLSVAAIESLIKCGAFSKFGHCYDLLWKLPGSLRLYRAGRAKGRSPLVMDGNGWGWGEDWEKISFRRQLRWEYEHLGYFISGNPLELTKDFNQEKLVSSNYIFSQQKVSTFRIAGLVTLIRVRRNDKGSPLYLVELEDREGNVEFYASPRQGWNAQVGDLVEVEIFYPSRENSYQLFLKKLGGKKCLRDVLGIT